MHANTPVRTQKFKHHHAHFGNHVTGNGYAVKWCEFGQRMEGMPVGQIVRRFQDFSEN